MEWLVHVRIKPPHTASADEIAQRTRIETERAEAMSREGHLVRVWRIPGEWANWGLWSAGDATELHALLSTLPLYKWADVTVHPLAQHPIDPVALRAASEAASDRGPAER
ncbi:MAG TPA: muconolactone Delta-isomerase family protein [Jatrophihabitans sp.]|nr:muconolactone Delta-isomerase family protein [Jatrophihabitans sp.]